MIELIGTNAGLVWTVLNEGGKMSVKAVKKAKKQAEMMSEESQKKCISLEKDCQKLKKAEKALDRKSVV